MVSGGFPGLPPRVVAENATLINSQKKSNFSRVFPLLLPPNAPPPLRENARAFQLARPLFVSRARAAQLPRVTVGGGEGQRKDGWWIVFLWVFPISLRILSEKGPRVSEKKQTHTQILPRYMVPMTSCAEKLTSIKDSANVCVM